MGLVYEAFDRKLGQFVALKTLLRFTPSALYCIKQESRPLADVIHPNLVTLHELVATKDDDVFFTMELVRGVDFVTHALRPEARSRHRARRHPTTLPTLSGGGGGGGTESHVRIRVARAVDDGPAPLTPASAPSPADFEQLRPALKQLVGAVSALHDAGKVHRDIKPSNVLVTAGGRVVLLDFGVATDLPRASRENVAAPGMIGTARYVAPEQASEGAATAAGDWYSVGVILYEVLVGRAPFAGPVAEVIARKNLVDPPAPSQLVTAVPPELDALCGALLRRTPANRPTGQEISRWLEEGTPAHCGPSPRRVSAVPAPLIGRAGELGALRNAFEFARRQSRLITVRVHGASGAGKSALVRHFLDEIQERGEAVALCGRTYERESMPYKALDSLIDELSRYLMRLAEEGQSIATPSDAGALGRLFPVLRRVEGFATRRSPSDSQPQEVRRRAIVALRELLATLAVRQPIVLHVEDVHWGDTESAELLAEIVRPPFAAPVLLIATHREEAAGSSPFLIEAQARWPQGADVRDVAL